MLVKIEAGKIKVLLDDHDPDIRVQQVQLLVGAIGSAHVADEENHVVSCTLSAFNLRKIRQLLPGIKRSHDEVTDATISALRATMDEYEAQSKLAANLKASSPADLEGYAFKVKPFAHQLASLHFVRSLPTPALFSDCGGGKTATVGMAYDSLVQQGEKWVLLVCAPVNLIQHVWLDDIARFTNLSAISLRVEHSNPTKRRELMQAALLTDADVYVINPEQLRAINQDKTKQKGVLSLLKRRRKAGYRLALIIDESSKLKSRMSATYKALRTLRAVCERCVIMSGTPAPNGIQDLWAQFSVLDDGLTLQPSFTDFRHDTHHQIQLRGVTWKDKGGQTHTATKWAEKKEAPAKIYRNIEPRMIRFRLDDFLDIPRQYIMRDVEMSEKQTSAYEDMEERLFTELEGDPVTARVAAVKLMKLREVTGGFLITDAGTATPLDTETPKMIELDGLLAQSIGDKLGDSGSPLKALVWIQYRWEAAMLTKRYEKLYGAKALVGGISQVARDGAIRAFKNDPTCRLLICHPQSVGHGLTLTEASYAFYYSLSYNYEELYQSSRRIVRPGQKRPVVFYFLIVPKTIDEDMVDALCRKKDLSDLVTDGKFSREEFLARRQGRSRSQLQLEWEVPNESEPEPGAAP